MSDYEDDIEQARRQVAILTDKLAQSQELIKELGYQNAHRQDQLTSIFLSECARKEREARTAKLAELARIASPRQTERLAAGRDPTPEDIESDNRHYLLAHIDCSDFAAQLRRDADERAPKRSGDRTLLEHERIDLWVRYALWSDSGSGECCSCGTWLCADLPEALCVDCAEDER